MTFLKIAAVAATALTLTACTTATRANWSDFTHGTGQYAAANDPSKNCYQVRGSVRNANLAKGSLTTSHVTYPYVRCPYAQSDFIGGW